MSPLLDTRFVTVYDPTTRPLSFVLLELGALAWAALTLRHALRDRARLLTWVTIVVYGVVMELLSYNLTTAFAHGQFTVMFYDRQLPLYVIAIYPVLLYTGIAVARTFRLPAWREALAAGALIVALDVPFDLAGPPLGWWRWSDTDPNLAVRWWGVPVTSFYWHLAFGACLALLTRRPRGLGWAPLLAAATIAGGFLAFLPFHGLHALGVPDGAIVGAALAGATAAAYARRTRG